MTIFTWKHLCRSFFLIKLQAFRAVTLLKRNSTTDVLEWNLRNFQEHLLRRTSANGCFWQSCPNTAETTLHKKCWLKACRYTFAWKPAVSNMSGSLFLTGYYIVEQSWVFLFNVGSGVYLQIAAQQWTGAETDWNTSTGSHCLTLMGKNGNVQNFRVSYSNGRSFYRPEMNF